MNQINQINQTHQIDETDVFQGSPEFFLKLEMHLLTLVKIIAKIKEKGG
ncbi:hypothetical protein J7J45_01340 [Candidatus Aerophobetes bacterium]|nr:hypothetical protein [Candidatus Aerophobetes bacterium]